MTLQFQISYQQAREYAKTLNLFQERQWVKHTKTKNFPKNIPKLPDIYFGRRKKWISWEDFLGYDKERNYKFDTYENAKQIFRKNNLKSLREIQKFAREYNKNHKIKLPTNPNIVYKHQWKGINDFLGTGRIWLSYKQVKKLIKGKFNSRREYSEFRAKNPQKYPSEQHYNTTNEWKGWGDFLGTGYVSTQFRNDGYYWSYKEAKQFVKSLKLSGQRDWEIWNRANTRPKQMPFAVDRVYQKQWKGWSKFFGNKKRYRLKQKRISFIECKKFARTLKLKSSSEWYKYVKTNRIPDNVPKDPFDLYYYKEKTWTNWSDFLGSEIISTTLKHKNFFNYSKAKKWAKTLKLGSSTQWVKFVRRNKKKFPDHIPRHPFLVYRNKGWKSWGDFLNFKEIPRGNFLAFFEAKKYLRSLKLKSLKHYVELYDKGKLTKRLPRNLHSHYFKNSTEFIGIADMIGTKSRFTDFWTFDQARVFIKKLNLQSQKEYLEAKKAGLIPNQIPSHPNQVYS